MAHENGAPAAFEIPSECNAGVVVNEGPNFEVQVKKVPVPEIGTYCPWACLPTQHCSDTEILGPDDVLIKLNATGLCMSDVHFMLNDWAMPPMSTFGTICAGHEGAGVIVKVGDRVTQLKVGQRAGLKPVFESCGSCDQCRTGRDNYCQTALHTGLHVDGEFCR